MAQLKAVIFDVDGTLVQTYGLGMQSTNVVLGNHGLAAITRPEYEEGAKFCTGIRMCGHAGLEPTPENQKMLGGEYDAVEITMISAERCPLYDGMREMLAELRQRGLKIAALSNGNTATSTKKLAVNGILGYFDVVHGADTVPAAKPSPDGIAMICAKLGVRPDEAAMVGDSQADAGAAKAAGVTGIGAFWDSHAAKMRPSLEGLFGPHSFGDVPALSAHLQSRTILARE
eukprot:m51a1_g5468 hypothetical protein (230) ;mRNA; r:274088-274926